MLVAELRGVQDPSGLLQLLVDALVLFAGEIAGDGASDDAAGEAAAFGFTFGDAPSWP